MANGIAQIRRSVMTLALPVTVSSFCSGRKASSQSFSWEGWE